MSASAFDYNLKIENKKQRDILALRPLFSGQGKIDLAEFKLVLIIPQPGESHTAKISPENFYFFVPHYTSRAYDIVLGLKRGRSQGCP